MNINLIGMRGAGKSNVSRRLSVMTKRPVLSTDTLITYEAGRPITELVADQGWRAFRDLEFAVVEKVCRITDAIVDCGGGIVVDLDEEGQEVFSERKVSRLRAAGPVVWLKGDIDVLVERVAAKADRPTLDETQSAAAIMRRRLPFYEAAADHVVEIGNGLTRGELAAQVHALFAGDLWDTVVRGMDE